MAQIARTSPGEPLVISALLNSHDVDAAARLGITAEQFVGYREEYNWLVDFPRRYQGEEPSEAAFRAVFPDFDMLEHTDVRSAVDIMLRSFYEKRLYATIDTASRLIGMHDPRGAWELLNAAEPVFTSPAPRNLVTDMSFLDGYADQQDCVEVPSHTLQRATGGLGKGQLWYLAARTNHGKSAHLCDWVMRAVRDGRRVKFYSLEMTEMEVRARTHAITARRLGYLKVTAFEILHRKVDQQVYKQFVEDAAGRYDGALHVHTPADGPVTPTVIASSIADYDLVVVDHVGLMRPDGGGHTTDDWRVAARNSNSLKELALSANKPILGAVQINRLGAQGSRPPGVDNLAGTDSLGQDADVVVTMRSKSDVATSFWTPKTRNGPKARWFTKFDVNRGDFAEITEDQADQLAMERDDQDG